MTARCANVVEVLETLQADREVSFALFDGQGSPCDPATWQGLFVPEAFSALTCDSRRVADHALFVCKGASFDVSYLEAAVFAGACAYVAGERYEGVALPCIVVNDVRRVMARLACLFCGDPSLSLDVVGVTGTKGKTTVAFYLDAILREAGDGRSALLTGVVIDDGAGRTPSLNTTPEPIELQTHLANAVDAGCTRAVMEVSSQGLKYHRTLGTRFAVGVFTNIGEDHISDIEHPSFDDYFASKLLLFAQSNAAVVNADMDRANEVRRAALEAGCSVVTYSTKPSGADVCLASCVHVDAGAWELAVGTPAGQLEVRLNALGAFNVSNALAAIATAGLLGIERDAVVRGLGGVRVPGRMERYDAPDGSIVGIVDYAHNEMSLEAVLRCVRDEFAGREVTVVFGSAGDRGHSRRPGLGRAAGAGADRIIITEDDPAATPVEEIANEIAAPLRAMGKGYQVISDREEAVRAAVEGASRPAVVVLAGKGVEDTIRRKNGIEPCRTDAELFCRAVGIAR